MNANDMLFIMFLLSASGVCLQLLEFYLRWDKPWLNRSK